MAVDTFQWVLPIGKARRSSSSSAEYRGAHRSPKASQLVKRDGSPGSDLGGDTSGDAGFSSRRSNLDEISRAVHQCIL